MQRCGLQPRTPDVSDTPLEQTATPAAGTPPASSSIESAASEAELIKRLRAGSSEAASALVRAHWDDAFRTAALITGDRQIAEDLAQEGLLRCIAKIEQFDPARPFQPWMRRIVTNRALDWLRSPAVERERPAADVERPAGPGSSGALSVTDPDLLAALAKLGTEERVAVVLQHVLGFTPAEIAEMSREPEGTVRSRVHRALGRLRASLEGASENE